MRCASSNTKIREGCFWIIKMRKHASTSWTRRNPWSSYCLVYKLAAITITVRKNLKIKRRPKNTFFSFDSCQHNGRLGVMADYPVLFGMAHATHHWSLRSVSAASSRLTCWSDLSLIFVSPSDLIPKSNYMYIPAYRDLRKWWESGEISMEGMSWSLKDF